MDCLAFRLSVGEGAIVFLIFFLLYTVEDRVYSDTYFILNQHRERNSYLGGLIDKDSLGIFKI